MTLAQSLSLSLEKKVARANHFPHLAKKNARNKPKSHSRGPVLIEVKAPRDKNVGDPGYLVREELGDLDRATVSSSPTVDMKQAGGTLGQSLSASPQKQTMANRF